MDFVLSKEQEMARTLFKEFAAVSYTHLMEICAPLESAFKIRICQPAMPFSSKCPAAYLTKLSVSATSIIEIIVGPAPLT